MASNNTHLILGWKGYFYNMFVYLNLYFLKEQVYKNASTHFFCKKYCVIFLLGVKYACLTMTCVRMNKNSTHKEVFFSFRTILKKNLLENRVTLVSDDMQICTFYSQQKAPKKFCRNKIDGFKSIRQSTEKKIFCICACDDSCHSNATECVTDLE